MFGCNHYNRAENGPDGNGWPLAINTTTVDGHCPVPIWGSDPQPYLPNTYAIADGIMTDCGGAAWAAAKIKLAKCHKSGFKVAQARLFWPGFLGFCESPLMGSTAKYLTKKETFHYLATGEYDTDGDGVADGTTSDEYTVVRTTTINRFSGEMTVTTSAEIPEFSPMHHLSFLSHRCALVDGAYVCTALDGWGLDGPPTMDGGVENLQLTTESMLNKNQWSRYETDMEIPAGSIQDLMDGEGMYDGAGPRTVSRSVAADVFEVGFSFSAPDFNPFEPQGPGEPLARGISMSYEYKVELLNPLTVAAMSDELDEMLDYWNFDDDVEYPFRTDEDTHYAPLVTYDSEGNLRGKPVNKTVTGLNRGGNQPFWDSNHPNSGFDSVSGCDRVASRGAYAPDWCPNATQWTEDTSWKRFVQGAFFSYNNFTWNEDYPCSTPVLFAAGYAIKTKWCEILTWEYPAHNYARPCGADDRAVMDGGSPRWPDAPCFCNDPTQTADCETPQNPEAVNPLNTTTPKGDFCVKRFGYNFRALALSETTPNMGAITSVSCGQYRATRNACGPTVIYIQKNPPSRPGAIHIAPPTLETFDETYGSLAVVQIKQRMIDPLWREGDSEFPQMEECRDCAETGGCEGYVDAVNAGGAHDYRCEPEEDKAWITDLGAP